MAAGASTFFPVVFVTNEYGFFKVREANLGVTPFKEVMLLVDQMHIASDTMYFFVKVNQTAFMHVMTLANVKYEVMTVSAETIVNIMTHVLPCTPEVKAFCKDPINTSMFHTLYNFYGVCIKNIQSVIASELQPTTLQTANSPSVDQPKDEISPSIDQLVEQWAESDTSVDPIDAFLMDFSNEDIAIAHANFEATDFYDSMNIDNVPFVDV